MELPTEEDLRAKVLVPYLAALGIGPDRCKFEKSFKVRVGKLSIEIGKKSDREHTYPRLDILVTTEDDEPLFVVEVKRDAYALGEEDIEQGISYARLVHPIAPFMLLTNGKDSRLYDTLTKEELTTAALPQRAARRATARSWITVEDLEFRYQAMQSFLGYSGANLREFANAQREANMAGLRGSQTNKNLKYLPIVYTERKTVAEAVDRFLCGDRSVFVLVGESGTGKTNELCALAERLGTRTTTLFYDASQLRSRIDEVIAEEFNWHFSEGLSLPKMVKKLQQIAERTGEHIVVIVDAIDESEASELPQSLNELIGHVSNVGNRLKFIVSLKTSSWPRFARSKGTPTKLAMLCASPSEVASSPENSTKLTSAESDLMTRGNNTDSSLFGGIIRPTFVLEEFNDDERNLALEKYRMAFGFQGVASREILTAVRDPFLMRILAETYGSGKHLPSDLIEMEVVRLYVERKLEKIDDEAQRTFIRKGLDAVARSNCEDAAPILALPLHSGRSVRQEARRQKLMDQSADSSRSTIAFVPLDVVEKFMGATPDSALRKGVELGLLENATDPHGRERFRFRYERVRDYVIAMRVLRFDELEPNEFLASLPRWIEHAIIREALRMYMRTPVARHVEAISAFERTNVEAFLDIYEGVRDRLGAMARYWMTPGGNGNAGAVYSIKAGEWIIGLFSRENSRQDGRIIRLDNYSEVWWDAQKRHEVIEPLAQKIWQTKNFSFALDGAKRKGAELALAELRFLVERRNLEWRHSALLAQEAVLAIVGEARDILGFPPRSFEKGLANGFLLLDLLPLSTEDIRMRANAAFGEQFFLQKAWEHLESAMPIQDNVENYSISMEASMYEVSKQRGREEALQGRGFSPVVIRPGDGLDMLDEAIDVVERYRKVLDSHYLPGPDRISSLAKRCFDEGYSDERLRLYIDALMGHVAREYPRMVEANFRGLTSLFRLARLKSFRAVVEYARPQNSVDRGLRGGSVIFALREGEFGADVSIRPEGSVGGGLFDERDDWILGPIGTSFSTFNRPLTNVTGAESQMPIRRWLYYLLEKELAKLTPEDIVSALGS